MQMGYIPAELLRRKWIAWAKEKLKDLSRLERGKELLRKGKLGLDPRGNWKETMKKGPTPLGALGLRLYGTGVTAETVLDGPTKGDCL